MTTRRSLRPCRLAAAFLAACAAAVVAAGPAWAHVEAEGDTAPDGTTTVTFSFHHGCSGAATTALRVQLPAGTSEVVPVSAPDGWTGSVAGDELSWSGGSVPDDDEASFVATMRLVGAAGTTVFLPAIQVCGSTEQGWVVQSDDPEADDAAPRVVLSADVAAATTTSAAAPTSAVQSTLAPSTTEAGAAAIAPSDGPLDTDAGGGLSTGAVVGIVAAAAVVLGIGAVTVRRRSTGDPGSGDPV